VIQFVLANEMAESGFGSHAAPILNRPPLVGRNEQSVSRVDRDGYGLHAVMGKSNSPRRLAKS
jgi:hypothetical protein